MDITKMTATELKSLAYDFLVQIEQLQNNLKAVNQMIQEKSKPEANIEPTETE